jgi:hypothetical protein
MTLRLPLGLTLATLLGTRLATLWSLAAAEAVLTWEAVAVLADCLSQQPLYLQVLHTQLQ